MSNARNWDDDAWGSSLLEELERVARFGSYRYDHLIALGHDAASASVTRMDVYAAIEKRTRDIMTRASDHHVSDLADIILVLTSMLKHDERERTANSATGASR